jgi:hypothetical protein
MQNFRYHWVDGTPDRPDNVATVAVMENASGP